MIKYLKKYNELGIGTNSIEDWMGAIQQELKAEIEKYLNSTYPEDIRISDIIGDNQ